MKKLLLVLGLTTSMIIGGCAVDKELLTKEELSKWTIKDDGILYDNKLVAVYDHVEYELNPSHGKGATPIVELSITQISFEVPTEKLIKFVHTKHSKQKVEIVVPRHNGQ
jgi:hypothetical protein